jgi:RNA polymerase sigma-70 factor, ECF subfamily
MADSPIGTRPPAYGVTLVALHDAHAAALRSHARWLTRGDTGRADDIVQETMLRAWRHLPRLDPEVGSIRAWLFATARRIAIDHWRRASRELPYAQLPDGPTSEDVEDVIRNELVAVAIEQLSQPHRAILRETFYDGRSVAEVANRLGIPAGTVKSRTHYALRALRSALAELGVDGLDAQS